MQYGVFIWSYDLTFTHRDELYRWHNPTPTVSAIISRPRRPTTGTKCRGRTKLPPRSLPSPHALSSPLCRLHSRLILILRRNRAASASNRRTAIRTTSWRARYVQSIDGYVYFDCVLSRLAGIPCTLVAPRSWRASVLLNPAARSAEGHFTPVKFHLLLIQTIYRVYISYYVILL